MKRSIFVISIIVFTMALWGQCVVSNLPSAPSSTSQNPVGQSFTTTCAGEITSIRFNNNSPTSSDITLEIFVGESDDPGDRVYSASGISFVSGANVIPVSPPIPVNDASLYTFIFDYAAGNLTPSFDTGSYLGGRAYLTSLFTTAGHDFLFEVNIAAVSSPAATPISPFAIIAALALIGFAGLYFVKQ